jgi:[ribosomal protein S5]-alanine N-acetyltransferase
MMNQLLPEFETDRLYLRGMQVEDCASYELNFADYEVIQHLSYVVPWPYPKGGVEHYFEREIKSEQGISRWQWVIFLKDSRNEVIGCIDLWRDGHPEHRGFWLAKKYWRKGYMTEAVIPVTDYAFNILGFEELIFSNAVENSRSRRVKEKTGVKFINRQPARFVNPSYQEREIWKLSKENWQKIKKGG